MRVRFPNNSAYLKHISIYCVLPGNYASPKLYIIITFEMSRLFAICITSCKLYMVPNILDFGKNEKK